MELDELKLAWQSLDRRIDAYINLNQQVLMKDRRHKARGKLRPLVWGQGFQMIMGLFIALIGGSFWYDFLEVPHLFFAGLSLHIYGIVLILFGGAMQHAMNRIDYSASIITIQKQLTLTRRLYVMISTVLGMVWWLLWIPLMMVFLAWAFGVDFYAHQPLVMKSWWIIGIGGLLATSGFFYWASKHPKLSNQLERLAAGKSLNDAQAFLDEIAAFEKI
jgi:hypothetical protein